MKTLSTLFVVIVLFASCKNQKNTSEEHSDTMAKDSAEQPIAERMAYANGFENFSNINELDFTFNVKTNDTLRVSRAWKWWPKEDKVQLIEKQDTVTYNRKDQMDDSSMNADKKFVNDSYWLLFPFQIMWSDNTIKESATTDAPISGNKMNSFTVSYSKEGGYTPGDSYQVFYESGTPMIKEWTYNSSDGRSLSTTWEDYETFKGIKISKMHNNADGSFQLYFTDIKAE
ncbi:MAG: hypothetical protein WCD31_00820 [Gillisia sp.]